jgi:hypothetical protein
MTYLVRQIMPPLRIPMRQSEHGELLHAVPRHNFTPFDTLDAATQAIGQTVRIKGRDDAEFEILSVEEYEASLTASARRSRKLAQAAKAAKPEESVP